MAWGSGDEMRSLSGQVDLTHPTKDNRNYRYSGNPRVACRFCTHFTAPSDCDLLGSVRAVDVCDAFAPDPHPEPVDLDALDFSEGDKQMKTDRAGIAGSSPVLMPTMISPTVLSQFLDHGVSALRQWKGRFKPGSREHRMLEGLEHDFQGLKTKHCPSPVVNEAIESWRREYGPARRERHVARSTPLADAAIRAWRESYGRLEQHRSPTVNGATDDAAASIRAFRAGYKR
jgi:hypothetical protein